MNTPRSSTSSLPPEYASPSDAPTYSAEPYAEECRLAFTPRYQLHTPRNGTVAKKNKAVSVVFHEQDEGSSMPSYVQRESVRGDVILEKPEKVTHVFVQVSIRTAFIAYATNMLSLIVLVVSWKHAFLSRCPTVALRNPLSSRVNPSYGTHKGRRLVRAQTASLSALPFLRHGARASEYAHYLHRTRLTFPAYQACTPNLRTSFLSP